MKKKDLKSLSTVKNGQVVRLLTVEAGHGLRSRLSSMGLVPNVEIKVVKNGHPGPFIVMVKNSKIILGRGMANKIMVLADT